MTDGTLVIKKDGEELYEYFIHHFDDLFEPTGAIRRFNMRYTWYDTMPFYEEVYKRCGKKVHREIILWIREEQRTGRLFDKKLWKPCLDQDSFHSIYYGYRKLFFFHDFFYFQLIIEHNNYDTTNREIKSCIVLQAGLYGWKEKGTDSMKPHDTIIMEKDMMIPDRYWSCDKDIKMYLQNY